jgi:hypothetical protein
MVTVPVSGFRISISTSFERQFGNDDRININYRTLWQPERYQIDTSREQSRTTMNEFAELGDTLHQVAGHQLTHPKRRFLSKLGLEFYFQNSITKRLYQYHI